MEGEDAELDILVMESIDAVAIGISAPAFENVSPNTGRVVRGARVPQRPPPWKGPRAPPGDCTVARRNELQTRVKQLCDVGDHGRTCNETRAGKRLTCKEISARSRLNTECMTARRRINQECYRGGDKAHQDAEREAITALNECRKLWREEGRNCETRDRQRVQRGKRSRAMFE